MDDTERTRSYSGPQRTAGADLLVTVFDGRQPPQSYRLLQFHSSTVTFGRRTETNDPDIPFSSRFVSRRHGQFLLRGDTWYAENLSTTNQTLLNMMELTQYPIRDGDVINIFDNGDNSMGVLMVFSAAEGLQWQHVELTPGATATVGRDPGCDICLSHVSVSKRHASLSYDGRTCTISDLGSTNGTYVNGEAVRGRMTLREKDVVSLADSKLIYYNGHISYFTQRSGIRLEAQRIVKAVTNKKKIICNDVTLTVEPCEMVAIIGGSGAGKSTIMNCISGYSIPTRGRVFINGMDLYQNYNAVRSIIGYVPQQDIVYDGLTVQAMLEYTAKLRLPADTSAAEMHRVIDRVLEMVDLTERRGTLIKSLSGGQKKRASIAVELISDPKLFFLDEPASGLDPGTERSLMKTLKKMAQGGKTIIMVTHSTLNLKMFDKIVFMGKGGNLCFYGSYDEACRFFGVDDVVDVYNMITDDSEMWKERFLAMQEKPHRYPNQTASDLLKKKGGERSALTQFAVLSKRYLHLIVNDRARMILLLGLSPLLTFLITMVANGQEFIQFEMTQAVLFSLACCAYFIGTLNSIQEICKERNILRREYMTGLKLRSYVASKVLVLALICLLQSLSSTGLFFLKLKGAEDGLLMAPFPETLITVFLTCWSSSVIGLFVSSMVKNADRAMTLAPLLLMPQLLFAGVIFELKDVTEIISWIAACRWSMQALGASANINAMESKVQQTVTEKVNEAMAKQFPVNTPSLDITIEAGKDIFEHTKEHILTSWGILIAFILLFSVASGLMLSRIKSERK